ncbi:MAG: hypothetical protein ACTSUP_02830 [Candidatus Heimdallarchaeaceae archaeon]
MTSKKQMRANKNNARKANGPNDTSITRFNAVKHGILCKHIPLSSGKLKGEGRAFEVMFGTLLQELQPEGILEKVLVEKIGCCLWQQKRILRSLSGHISYSLDGIEESVEANMQTYAAMKSISSGTMNKYEAAMLLPYELSSGELMENIDKLHEAKAGLKGGKTPIKVMESLKYDDLDVSRPDLRKELIERIEYEIIFYECIFKKKKELIKEKASKLLECRIVPPEDVLDPLLRYQASVDKQLYRALHELERLQRMRKGENIPSPVMVDVDTGK